MPDEGKSNGSDCFVREVLPWLLAAGMSAIYLLTLNHWVSPESLRLVTKVSGLDWQADLFRPVTILATWPFRWLPAVWIPLALNLFAAGCAALSLAWLARAVALLPHNQTEIQRHRLRGDRTLLTIRSAWLPPTLAVLVCGLQFSFWEHAISATGEMFDLLLFAWLVRCLLELRADGNSARLRRFALVYGLSVANNWAMVAFGPLFLLGAFWAARANPFDVRFLERVIRGFKDPRHSFSARVRQGLQPFNPHLLAAILGCFLAGLSLILLLPLAASTMDDAQTDFWPALHAILRTYKRFLLGAPKPLVLQLCLSTVLPALFITIRWGRQGGGMNLVGRLTAAMFQFVHCFFLAVTMWVALDLILSPRVLVADIPCLPLYFLGALSAGYFSGYCLLVFGTRPRDAWRRPGPLARLVNRSLTVAIWVALAAMPALLLGRNLPQILWSRSGALENYAGQIERSLPPAGAVLLNDGAFRLSCLETTLIRGGQQAGYMPMNTSLLAQEPDYFQFVQERHPDFRLATPDFLMPGTLTNLSVLAVWLQDLAAARSVYCLHPVIGHLGESFSVQPHGLFYRLTPCAANALNAGPLPPEVLAENRAFWRAAARPLAELVRHLQSPEPPARPSRWQRFLKAAHVQPETDRWSRLFGSYYSGALNFWGVELQIAGQLAEAGDCFALALQLNPDNAAAQINREFNQDLQAHKPVTLQSVREVEARLGERRSLAQILQVDGPVDEPNVCFKLGTQFAAAQLPRQAVQEFARAQAFFPDHADIALLLADQLLQLADCTNALAEANHALQLQPQNPDGLLFKSRSLLMFKEYERAIAPLSDLLNLQTNPPARLARAFAYLQLGNLDAAHADYEQAAQSLTNACRAYFGLAEIAYRRKDVAAAIKYGELCLSNAPPNLMDSQLIKARLAELRGEL